jgi:hypothetical protein
MPCGLTAKRSEAVTPCCKYQVSDNLQCLGPTTRTPGYYSILSATKKTADMNTTSFDDLLDKFIGLPVYMFYMNYHFSGKYLTKNLI